MAKQPEQKPEKTQRERFIETAREMEADESGAAFEKAFDEIAKAVKPLKRRPRRETD